MDAPAMCIILHVNARNNVGMLQDSAASGAWNLGSSLGGGLEDSVGALLMGNLVLDTRGLRASWHGCAANVLVVTWISCDLGGGTDVHHCA
eukprot:scaffold5356_cov23-Tisochrysis_lutea.AAC.1